MRACPAHAIDTYGAEAEAEVVREIIADGACNVLTLDDERALGQHLLALHNAIHIARDDAEARRARDVLAQWGVNLVHRIVCSAMPAIDARAQRIAKDRREGARA